MLLKIVASLAVLIGAVWILQGLNILPGSFMTGRMEWAWERSCSPALRSGRLC